MVVDDLLGKYAIFVVPAYVLTVGGFLAFALYTRYRLKYWKRRLRDEERRTNKPPQ
jgi:heme exporter protein CcmD